VAKYVFILSKPNAADAMPKETKVRLSFRFNKIIAKMITPVTGLVCNRMGIKVVYSISKNSTIALIYAVRHRGHLEIRINKIVERKDIEPFAASTFFAKRI